MLVIRAMRELVKVIAGLVEDIQKTLPVVARLRPRDHLRAIGQHGLAKKLGLAQARRGDLLEVHGSVRYQSLLRERRRNAQVQLQRINRIRSMKTRAGIVDFTVLDQEPHLAFLDRLTQMRDAAPGLDF
jgi:hypothetical protein